VPLRQFRFVEFDHDVVARSRRTNAVRVAGDGRVFATAGHEQRPWLVFDGPNGVPWSRDAADTVCAVR